MRRIDSQETQHWERFYRANFFNSLAGYKSANLIGTRSKEGLENLALFFSVIHVGANPPLLGMLFRPHTVPRHTLENIRETGWFSVNSVQENWLEKAHQCSAKYPRNTSEFEAVGLKAVYENDVPVPFVEESALRYACSFQEEHLISANQTIFLVGQVEAIFVLPEMLTETGHLNHPLVKTVAINALDRYYRAEEVAQLPFAEP